MNIIGQTIKHRTLGSGIVKDLTAEFVTVCFQDSEKKFMYPDAFKNFMILKDQKTQRYVEKQIKDKETAIYRKNQIKQAERNRRRKLLNFKVSANSHAVFNISSEQAEQTCKEFSVSTGKYLSGYSKGQPRIADRIKPNSVCLLTNRPNGQAEQDRRIIGAFMVKEDFFGEDADNGIIEGHSKYRLCVPAENQLLFWEYVNQNTSPRWGNTAFKYCSVDIINQILFKFVDLFETTDQKETAVEFYRYFCKINRLCPLIRLETDNSSDVGQ